MEHYGRSETRSQSLKTTDRQSSALVKRKRSAQKKIQNEVDLFRHHVVNSSKDFGESVKSLTRPLPIEYWIAGASKWIDTAFLALSKTKSKLHLDHYLSGNLSRKVFHVRSLVVEHSNPISTNFLAVLSGGGQAQRHRIAFFSERDGLGCVSWVQKLGAQIVVRKRVSSPHLPRQNNDLTGSSLGIKFPKAEKEGGLGVVALRKSDSLKEIAGSEDDESMIIRRQSTGSYRDYLSCGGGGGTFSEATCRKADNFDNTRDNVRTGSGILPVRSKVPPSQRGHFATLGTKNRQLFKNRPSTVWYSQPTTTTMEEVLPPSRIAILEREKPVTLRRKMNSEQSLNSQSSDEFYYPEEGGYNSDANSYDSDFNTTDYVDGSGKVARSTQKLFSRLVTRTASLSASAPSLSAAMTKAKRCSTVDNINSSNRERQRDSCELSAAADDDFLDLDQEQRDLGKTIDMISRLQYDQKCSFIRFPFEDYPEEVFEEACRRPEDLTEDTELEMTICDAAQDRGESGNEKCCSCLSAGKCNPEQEGDEKLAERELCQGEADSLNCTLCNSPEADEAEACGLAQHFCQLCPECQSQERNREASIASEEGRRGDEDEVSRDAASNAQGLLGKDSEREEGSSEETDEKVSHPPPHSVEYEGRANRIVTSL